ncbi:MAG: Aminoacyl-tRNA hydrolase, peptidyl-tRNA hydrolase, family [Candidatus Taylorbacteria bacterium]|nr:Aminoacyl-tRNA hydrolase, peptidyl-tRNA hydrolase, family [Candidatus Taylorbacteria bacterium]
MGYIIVGLGNPEKEYENTRHNAGMIILDQFAKKNEGSDWKRDNTRDSLISKAEVSGEKVLLVKPQTFMNKSGISVKDLAGSPKKLEKLIVIQDDLDLPLGSMKIVFNRGSGGHKGIESIVRSVKSEAFARVRIGICPTTPTGKLKKPDHEKMLDFIVGDFKKPELDIIKKVGKKVCGALEVIVTDSLQKGMTDFN